MDIKETMNSLRTAINQFEQENPGVKVQTFSEADLEKFTTIPGGPTSVGEVLEAAKMIGLMTLMGIEARPPLKVITTDDLFAKLIHCQVCPDCREEFMESKAWYEENVAMYDEWVAEGRRDEETGEKYAPRSPLGLNC